MSKAWALRPATQAEIPVMAQLHAALLQRGWNINAFESFYARGEVLAWIAYQEDTPIGYLFGWAIAGECELLNIGLEPEWRGQGCGSALCRALIDACAVRGIDRIHLEVSAENVAAIALYTRHNFIVTRRRKDYYPLADGLAEDALTMIRETSKNSAGNSVDARL